MRAAAAGVVAALLALAPAAYAQAESPAPEKPPFLFDVGWDDGPTYQIAQRLPRLANYPWAEPAREVRLEGRIGASLQLDGGALAGDALADGPRFDVRRARLSTRGAFDFLLRTEYKIEFAVEDRDFFLNDFYLRWRPPRWVDSVRFGYFDPPIALQALTGSSDRSLMETAAPVSAFAPGYRLGVEAAGAVPRPSLTWTFNVSSVGQSQPNAEATSSSVLRGVGRLVWRPLGSDVSERLIHLGFSASHVLSGSGDLQYRARPETFLTPYLVDTDSFDANATLLGGELALRRRNVSLQGEYLHALVDADEGGSLAFQGGYVQLAVVLTGETHPYDVATATFLRLEPRAPYKPLRGQWGAFELTGRVSYLDLSDGPVDGGRMATLAFGPAWTWNRFVRLLGGYVYARVADAPGGSNAHVFQARIELRL
jgi:phosphate-selective porin